MRKEELYKICLMEVSRIKYLGNYHTIFLSTMLLRKMRHPEEKLKEIISKTQKKMRRRYSNKECPEVQEEKMRTESMQAVGCNGQNYGKNNFLERTNERCLEQLEDALEGAVIPKDWKLTGFTVEDVLDYMVKELSVIAELNSIKGLDDESLKFWNAMVLRKKYNPDIELKENIWQTLNELNYLKKDSKRSKEEEIKFQMENMELILSLKKVKIPTKWGINQSDSNILEELYDYLIQ
ncbi:MAG: hypothetical protein IJE05_03260 [Clostridia bacterium]|nr:hypothetical protein [Clostridia bacterium]